jgi:signal transduction histidine kinase
MTGPRQVLCCSICSLGANVTNHCAWDRLRTLSFFEFPFAFFHSIWVRLFCVGTGIVATWFVYWLRIRRTEMALGLRFDEQFAERTRVARDLHDTLLQTIEASKMVADDALDPSADPDRVRRAMSRLSDWLGHATEEGRAALHSLRTAHNEADGLAASLRRAGEDLLAGRSVEFSVSITGDSVVMDSMVRGEVYKIGYEAMRSACRHSGVSRLRISLMYGPICRLQVRAHGNGIDQLFAGEGKDDSFEMQRLQNRAERMGGELSLFRSASSAIELTLVVPGHSISRQPYCPETR